MDGSIFFEVAPGPGKAGVMDKGESKSGEPATGSPIFKIKEFNNFFDDHYYHFLNNYYLYLKLWTLI